MKRNIFAVTIIAALFATSVYAQGGGNSNNSDTINNFGDTNNTTYNQPAAYGGTGVGVGVGIGVGGQGGAGGDANAVSISQGGDAKAYGGAANAAVIGSGNSSVDVDNKNTNTNLNNNSAKADVTNVNGQGQHQGQGQLQGQSQSTKNANNSKQTTNVTVQGDNVNYEAQKRNPVSSAYAPANFPTATCMGSTSGGAQGIGFGVSFGTSWKDENCMKLEQIRAVGSVLGDRDSAAAMMCEFPAYAKVRASFCQQVKDGMYESSGVATAPLAQAAEPVVAARPAAYVGKPAEASAVQLY